MNMKYDVFTHPAGQRVIEEQSGKHGVVVQIKETAHEWIEPIIKFDDEDAPRRAHGAVWLEPIEVPRV